MSDESEAGAFWTVVALVVANPAMFVFALCSIYTVAATVLYPIVVLEAVFTGDWLFLAEYTTELVSVILLACLAWGVWMWYTENCPVDPMTTEVDRQTTLNQWGESDV